MLKRQNCPEEFLEEFSVLEICTKYIVKVLSKLNFYTFKKQLKSK